MRIAVGTDRPWPCPGPPGTRCGPLRGCFLPVKRVLGGFMRYTCHGQGLGKQVSTWAGDGRQEPGSCVGHRGLDDCTAGSPTGALGREMSVSLKIGRAADWQCL